MNCTLAIGVLEVPDDDAMLGVLPLLHVFGLSTVLNVCVRAGVSMVLLPRLSVDAVLETIQRHRVSQFAGVPTMLIALLDADTIGFDLTSLRVANSGGVHSPARCSSGSNGDSRT